MLKLKFELSKEQTNIKQDKKLKAGPLVLFHLDILFPSWATLITCIYLKPLTFAVNSVKNLWLKHE